jgi:hypothetical protein
MVERAIFCPIDIISKKIHNENSRRKSTMEGSIYTFRQFFTSPKTLDSGMMAYSPPSDVGSWQQDRFDMSHLIDRRHSISSLNYSKSFGSNEIITSSLIGINSRTRSHSVTEGVYTQSDNASIEENRPKKDPMSSMMLKGQLMDF